MPDARFHRLERFARVGMDRQLDGQILAQLGRVDVDVDDLRVRGVVFHVARHTVAEAHADGQNQVALLCHLVRGDVAVHAQIADEQRVPARHGRNAHQR